MNSPLKQLRLTGMCFLLVSAGNLFAEERLEMAGPQTVLQAFMKRMAQGQLDKAYELVAPSSVKNGDPIAYKTPLDFESFRREAEAAHSDAGEIPFPKFANYRLGKPRWEAMHIYRIFIYMGGDNDEVMVVWEQGRWYIADPIHLIR